MADQQPANAAPPAVPNPPQAPNNGPPPNAPDAPDNSPNQQQPGQQVANPATLTTNRVQTSSNSGSFSTSQGTGSGPSQTHFTIPITAPAGEIIITQPSSALGGSTPLFKLAPTGNPANASANWIVFGWNITNVYESVQPTSLTVRAGCVNGYTYPVGAADPQPSGNGTDSNSDGNNSNNSTSSNDSFNAFLLPDQNGKIPATQSSVTWDVVQYASQHPGIPVPEGVCTLQIADDRGFGAARRAGYLSPNEAAVTFAFYTGEAYVPIASGGILCPHCKPNSIMKAYDAHPVAISLWVTLAICLLSGIRILFRGMSMAHAKSASNADGRLPRGTAKNPYRVEDHAGVVEDT